MQYVTLNTGAQMPMMGFGVFRVPDLKECEDSVYEAIKIGYRLIDTATAYSNETAVGAACRRAIADGICAREDLFVTSKLWVTDMKDEATAAAGIDASLDRLDIGYLDLYLEHQACNDYFAAWRAMQDAYRTGKLRAIGVSNFYPNILTNFCECVEVVPAVNQVELHPYYTQEHGLMAEESAMDVMRRYGVVPEAWVLLGGGRYNPSEPSFVRMVLGRGSTRTRSSG
jgi:diketogulonate reductase-like aldo/keto reductase